MKINIEHNENLPLQLDGSNIPVRMGVGVFKGTFVGVAEIKQEKDGSYTTEISFAEKYRNILVSSLKNVKGKVLSVSKSIGKCKQGLFPEELVIEYK